MLQGRLIIDAKEFLIITKEICKKTELCENCPFYKREECHPFSDLSVDEMIEIVENYKQEILSSKNNKIDGYFQNNVTFDEANKIE